MTNHPPAKFGQVYYIGKKALLASLTLALALILPLGLRAGDAQAAPVGGSVAEKKSTGKNSVIPTSNSMKSPVQQKSGANSAPAKSAPQPVEQPPILGLDESTKNLPTYIKSDQLTVNNKERTFSYTGNVEVTQGDLILTAQILDGTYNEKNQIKDLTARQNVVILKGEEIRASGERATYDRISDTVVLTENPELSQHGSILSADRIRIFLKENRSVAEGQVRVKVVREPGKDGGSPLSLDSFKR